MYHQITNESHPNGMRLQGVGIVVGTPAINIKKDDYLLWNFGSKSKVVEIVRETKSFIVINELCSNEKIYTRKLKKTRLVCILQPKKDGN
jgi:hypothetical protein